MQPDRYAADVLLGRIPRRVSVPLVDAELGLVVEEAAGGFCGAVVEVGSDVAGATVTLEDRHGRRRVFPLLAAAFLLDGRPVTLVRATGEAVDLATRTASGSLAGPVVRARVAAPSRIWVEGLQDAALVEQVWGDDLRAVGVAVEPLHGIDELPPAVAAFAPTHDRRLGVLVDHLVPGSKEQRIAAGLAGRGNLLVVGHPYVDVWQAVKPAALGIAAWPVVPRGLPWKEGVCAALGWDGPADGWCRVRAAARSWADLEPALLGRVEQLIDFVTCAG